MISMGSEGDIFPYSLPEYHRAATAYVATDHDTDQRPRSDSDLNYGEFSDADPLFRGSFEMDVTDPSYSSNLYDQRQCGIDNSSSRFSPKSSNDSSNGSSTGLVIDPHYRSGQSPDESIQPKMNGVLQERQHSTAHPEDDAIGKLFDFDSAASSPTPRHCSLPPSSVTMPVRSTNLQSMSPFGYNPSPGVYNSSYEGSPLSITPNIRGSRHDRHVSENQPQYVHGSFLEPLSLRRPSCNNLQSIKQLSDPSTISHDKERPHVSLHASELPRTQRVETQMNVKLTIWPLPEGVSRAHFQSHTMARTKLVLNPSPEKSPSMLEVHAHCVCATAMQDPETLKASLERAAGVIDIGSGTNHRNGQHLSGQTMAEDEHCNPKNGGFVNICGQCIRRENKRTGRKKLKNNEEEEQWLMEQPKRIIVFNKAEILEWQPGSTYNDEGEADVYEDSEEMPTFPDGAMQIRFPMRIQCYSRHHEEKLGYRVIFTIKNWKGHLVAQTITNPTVITDDHKAQQSTKPAVRTRNSGKSPYTTLHEAKFPAATKLPLSSMHGLTLSNRNSFSSPELANWQQEEVSWPQRPRGRESGSSSIKNPKNLSRPASPSIPCPMKSKRRKGSSSSRIRSDLAMTKLDSFDLPNTNENSALHPQFSNILPDHGLATPPTSDQWDTRALSTSPSISDFIQHSQSLDGLQSHQNAVSAPPSIYQSQGSSPMSSPQHRGGHLTQYMNMEPTVNVPSSANPKKDNASIHKITPAEGSKSGGIEVTCLGEHFANTSVIKFGGIQATTIKLYSDSAILCRVPPAATAGPVLVTVSTCMDGIVDRTDQEPVTFRYVDQDEQDMIKQALQALHQQFMDGSAGTFNFARQILTSMGQESERNDLKAEYRSENCADEYSLSTSLETKRSLEATVIQCFEVIDLDDRPNCVNLNSHGIYGQGMLHTAAALGFYRVVAALLARGAHCDLRDNNGMTPMHIACLNGHLSIIRKLRSAGADPRIRSLNGICAADLTVSAKLRCAVEDVCTEYPSDPRAGLQSSYGRPHRRDLDISNRSLFPHLQSRILHRSHSYPDREREAVRIDCPVPPSSDWSSTKRHTIHNENKHRPMARIASASLETQSGGLAFGPAASLWRDQISAQIQQLQHSLQRAIPPIPSMPDYHANQVVRRISSLVPQRLQGPTLSSACHTRPKEADYHWWELLTGSISSPPAYEEIYPRQAIDTPDTGHLCSEDPKMGDIVQKNVRVKDDCSAKRTIGQSLPTLTSTLYYEDGPKVLEAHALRVKRLRSDRNLFFVWIPLLLLILYGILRDRSAQIWFTLSKAVPHIADGIRYVSTYANP